MILSEGCGGCFARGVQASKKTSQEDIDRAYLRLHTNMEDNALAQGQMNAHETAAFLTKSVDSVAVGASAFDGTLARIGGIKGLADESKQIADDEPKQNAEGNEEGEENSQDSDPDQPPGKKQKGQADDDIWMEREVVIAQNVRAQQTWQDEVHGTIDKLHKEFLEIRAGVLKDGLATTLKPEVNFAQVRGNALGYCLGLVDIDKSSDAQPAFNSSPGEPGPPGLSAEQVATCGLRIIANAGGANVAAATDPSLGLSLEQIVDEGNTNAANAAEAKAISAEEDAAAAEKAKAAAVAEAAATAGKADENEATAVADAAAAAKKAGENAPAATVVKGADGDKTLPAAVEEPVGLPAEAPKDAGDPLAAKSESYQIQSTRQYLAFGLNAWA